MFTRISPPTVREAGHLTDFSADRFAEAVT
jgi:hypothetical protein